MRYVTHSGHVVLLDDDVVLPGRLSIGSHGYAQLTGAVPGTVVLLHRWLLGLRPGCRLIGDHINRQPLDCRRENLRAVTPSESNLNRAAPQRDLPTHIYYTGSGRFHVAIKRHRYTHHLGTYSSLDEALSAREEGLMGLLPTDHLKRIAEELSSIRNLLVELVDIQRGIADRP